MHSHLTGKLLGATAMLALATGLGGCSIMPGWADPTSWFSSDDAAPGETPDLANIPDKPSTTGDTRNLADSLVSDMKHAQYSGEALRSGDDKAAAPPPDMPVDGNAMASIGGTVAASGSSSSSDNDETMGDVVGPSGMAAVEPDKPQEDRSVSNLPSGTSVPGALPDVSHARMAAPETHVAAAKPAAAKAPVQVASAAPVKKAAAVETKAETPAAPAAPSVSATPATYASATPSVQRKTVAAPQVDDLGFQASQAPPLDPSVSSFVPASIVSRYRNAAANAAGVVDDAASPAAAAAVSTHSAAMSAPSALAAATKTIVYFPGDIVTLNATAKKLVRKVAYDFRALGMRGYVRVVGHASSRTSDMPLKRHFSMIYKKSQDRADAVSAALVQDGVPADKILVEAVGDSQPVYYESMPKGEEGNRRVEIFLQG